MKCDEKEFLIASAATVSLVSSSSDGDFLKRNDTKALRFAWRAGRNLLCMTPWGRSLLFPSQSLANRFGPGDAEYAISVFLHHYRQLSAAGFPGADRILEVGPGQNAGTSLLMWALNHSRVGRAVTVILWDVFPNMVVDANVLKKAARGLLDSPVFHDIQKAVAEDRMDRTLGAVARGEVQPDIRYCIKPLPELIAAGEANDVTLVYSQAAIEHIWNVADFWQTIIGLTRPGGWHSHRIDLADHGRRETNYIEMLEWSPINYYLTMRFIPGAINRWRASTHMTFLAEAGLKILSASRETREVLPITRSRINRAFRSLDELDLRTTALDLVGVKTA